MRSAFGQTRGSRTTETRRHRARALLSGLLVLTVLATAGVASIGTTVPVAAQVVDSDFPTAAVAPEDALAYLVFILDTESDQWQLASDLLNRAGLGDLLEQARDEALTDAAGNDLPLDVFLGGEIALVLRRGPPRGAREWPRHNTGGCRKGGHTRVDDICASGSRCCCRVLHPADARHPV